MLTLELSHYGLVEMNQREQEETEGGNPYLIALAGYFIVESLTNPVSSCNALVAGFRASQD